MVELRDIAAILPVTDVVRAVEHYRRLGFEVDPYEGGGYAFARWGERWLHLAEFAELDPLANTSAVYLYVDDADALAVAWRDVPGHVSAGAVDTPYGLPEGAYTDPDGNLLRFGSPLA